MPATWSATTASSSALSPLAYAEGRALCPTKNSHKRLDKRRLTDCTFCKRSGHSAEKCWDKIRPLQPVLFATKDVHPNGPVGSSTVVCTSLAARFQIMPAKNAVCSFCSWKGHIALNVGIGFPSRNLTTSFSLMLSHTHALQTVLAKRISLCPNFCSVSQGRLIITNHQLLLS